MIYDHFKVLNMTEQEAGKCG